jgi:RNA polymerase sigma-70 factor, ECF subfamily
MTNEPTPEQVRERVGDIYHTESRRIFATLIRLLGDFDLAEDALHEAFRIAMEQWPRDGVPTHQPPGLARFDRPLQGH